MTTDPTLAEGADESGVEALRSGGVELKPDTPATPEPEKKLSRDEIMEKATKARSEQLAREMEEDTLSEGDLESATAMAEGLESKETIPSADAEVDVVVKPEVEPEKKPEKKVTIKVDGEDVTLTEAEIRELQKQEAADRRLREAARRTAELDAREQAIKVREAAVPVNLWTPEERATRVEKVKLLMQANFDEDPEKFLEALDDLSPKPVAREGALDRSAITQELDNYMFNRDLSVAKARFAKDFGHLNGDPVLHSMVNEQTKIEMQLSPDASPWEIISRSAMEVDAKLKKLYGGPVEKPPKTVADPDRVVAKRSAAVPAQPSAHSRAPIGDPPKPAPSPHDAFKLIANARGQRT